MSIVRCDYCDKDVDTDFDTDVVWAGDLFLHFSCYEEWEESQGDYGSSLRATIKYKEKED